MNRTHIVVILDGTGEQRRTVSVLRSIGCDVTTTRDLSKLTIGAAIDAIVIEEGSDVSATRQKIQNVLTRHPCLPVIVSAHDATVKSAVTAMHAGATDYLLAPLDSGLLKKTLGRCLELKNKGDDSHGISSRLQTPQRTIIYKNPIFEKIIEMARRVAPSMATVLISGESGTGKEVIAKFIHANSLFAGGPYVAVNCAALPENLAESELFGHEKGAFTGAVSRKPGKFEMASQGTLVLDEISEMPFALQAKLLRAIQERAVDPIGGARPVSVNTRLVAISNVDLRAAVIENRFREDLYYRINVIQLKIPPLRERLDDIPLLVRHFLEKFARQNRMPPKKISAKALRQLAKAPWGGNIRELENTIERAFLLTEKETIDEAHLYLETTIKAPPSDGGIAVGMSVKEMEKELIYKTLENVNNNRTRAAEILEISIRTLRNKLKEYEQADR